jgi:4-hydroxy-tetrahydrodipicolinate reductase
MTGGLLLGSVRVLGELMVIKVAVHGVLGRMGQEVLNAVCRERDLTPVGGADATAESGTLPLPDGSGTVPISSALADIAGPADVVVDFTNADGAMSAMRTASALKTNLVVGSTGLSEDNFREASALADQHGVGIFIAPNFALGAVVMVHLAKLAAPFFDYADLTEMHHEAKIDAPSGTALAIAAATAEGKGGEFISNIAEKQTLEGTRGGVFKGINIHSARMPGRVAHHELVFGTLGQTLTLRHDSVNRESFMPGVVMAVRHVVKNPGLTVGLENILGL